MPMADDIREALGLLTAWTGDGVDGQASAFEQSVDEYGDAHALPHLLSGMTNLAKLLLVSLAHERGVTPQETLQWLATRPWNQE